MALSCDGNGNIAVADIIAAVNKADNDAWENTQSYTKGDIVTYSNIVYVAIMDTTGVQPDTDRSKWSRSTGLPDEHNNKRFVLTTKGVTGDGEWTPFHYNPERLDKSRTIEANERAMVAGPFEIPIGMTLTVDPTAAFTIV